MAANQITTPTKCDDIQSLHGAIETMDAMSQGGFSEIAAIANLALLALEHQSVGRHSEDIAMALQAIRAKAQDIENCINATAEEVGCNWIDVSLYRRYAASSTAGEQGAAAEVA